MFNDKPHIQKWVGALAILFIIVIAFLDRTNVSVLITDKEFLQHFGIQNNRVAQGQLMSVFLFAYGIASMALSPLYETFLGVRKGYFLSIVIWGVFTLISPMVGSLFTLLLAFRAILGVTEGPLYSLRTMYVNEWFYSNERGKPNAVTSVGSSLGLAIGVPLTTYLVYSFSWHMAFYMIGLLNLVIGLPLIWFCLSKSRGPVYLEQQKMQDKTSNLSENQKLPPLQRVMTTIRLALTTPGLIWMILIQVCHQSYLWGTSSWLPSYLLQEKGFSLKAMGALASAPFIVSLCAGLLGGYIVDRIPKNKMASVFIVGGILTSTTVAFAVNANTPIITALLLILANAFWGMQSPTIPTIVQLAADKRSVGSAYGLMNGIGNFVSSFVPAAMGALIGLYGGFAAGFSLIIAAEILVVICGIRLLMHKKIKATQINTL